MDTGQVEPVLCQQLGKADMTDTSLHTSGRAGAPATNAPAPLGPIATWSSAWRASTIGARIVAVTAVIGLVVIATLRGDATIVSAVGLAVLVPAGLVDVIERRLPNRMVTTAAVALSVAIVASISGPVPSLPSGWLGNLTIGVGFMAGPLFALHLISPESMGFGDVKVGIVLGASLGVVDPQLALLGLFVASGGTAAAGLVTRQRHVAFGPGLILGSVIALAASPLLASSPSTSVSAASASWLIDLAVAS